ncbi:phosphotransferase family protein [Devosia nitrariae]|uniref:Aminoglycoside phosphotransferase n=1 Tax=Devosia nitrariae TaxID=2071872 RepID=A0ABQ5VZZ4_9HYPH|nr:aminoglycoside phosphotransferase family protein [Devosia nitrariae]GLQ53179.1 aminoglycoside phosphotransferase [Devosia nitrariae]
MHHPRGNLIGSGKEAEVYEFGDRVLKLYRAGPRKGSAFREAAILAAIESLDVPAPRVLGVEQFDGRWGVIMERAEGPAFAEAALKGGAALETHLAAMARLHAHIHAQPAPALGAQRAMLRRNISKTPLLDEVLRKRLLDGLAARPDGDRLCHGDFHPWNILGNIDTPIVVDWLDASIGVPAADICRSYVLMANARPDIATAYVDAYLAATGIARSEIEAWVPYVAAARLAEGVPDETERLLALARL